MKEIISKLESKKGITLVALVITIVVLLILAGASINLVVGNQGILTKSKKVSEDTKQAAIKEQIDLALTNYQIEKIANDNLNFKDYMEDEEQSGIKNFEVIDENPSEDVQLIGRVDGRIIIIKTDGSYVLAKGDNLVKNGFGKNGNENFPDFTNNNGVFSLATDSYRLISSSDFIEVDTFKKYYQAMIGKQKENIGFHYIGFAEYDRDKNLIADQNVMYVSGSLTYLEKELKDGDTEIYLNDLSGFEKSNLGAFWEKTGLIFWNYKDSTGYEYPEETYSKNVYYNLFDDSSFETDSNKIKLKQVWNHGTIAAETKISQSNKGANYNYGILANKPLNEKYKIYENKIEGVDNTGSDKETGLFRAGTKYVKILFLINWGNEPSNSQVNFKDIVFAECE